MARRTEKNRREYNRIRQFIYRAEKRGFRFDAGFKESLKTAHTNKLKALSPKKLYQKATALSESGQIVRGDIARKEEQRRAARLAARTRAARKRKKKEIQRLMEIPGPTVSDAPSIGSIIYDRIQQMIRQYESSKGAEFLQNLLKSDIKKFGFGNVMAGLAQIPEATLAEIEKVLVYVEEPGQLHRSFQRLDTAIRGYTRTEEEAKQLGRVLDSV